MTCQILSSRCRTSAPIAVPKGTTLAKPAPIVVSTPPDVLQSFLAFVVLIGAPTIFAYGLLNAQSSTSMYLVSYGSLAGWISLGCPLTVLTMAWSIYFINQRRKQK